MAVGGRGVGETPCGINGVRVAVDVVDGASVGVLVGSIVGNSYNGVDVGSDVGVGGNVGVLVGVRVGDAV